MTVNWASAELSGGHRETVGISLRRDVGWGEEEVNENIKIWKYINRREDMIDSGSSERSSSSFQMKVQKFSL